MTFAVQIMPRAERSLERLPQAVRRRADKKIVALANDPRPQGCVKLSGFTGLYRIRVGDYRIVYEIHDDRRDVYRGL